MSDSSVPLALQKSDSEKIGSWLGAPKIACKICQSDIRDTIHRYRYEGMPFREMERVIRDEHSISISYSHIAKHFRYHFLVNKNIDLEIHGLTHKDQESTSIDQMIAGIQSNTSLGYM